jgi:hypothetical protein
MNEKTERTWRIDKMDGDMISKSNFRERPDWAKASLDYFRKCEPKSVFRLVEITTTTTEKILDL